MTKVVVGSMVQLQLRDCEVHWRIVGAADADLACGRISAVSPLGAALLGRRAGDYCAVQSPGKTYGVGILDVS